jgi:hypothetical protein
MTPYLTESELPERLPHPGELVRLRSRHWLVENVNADSPGSPVIALACADDDAQGQELEVFWDYEPDRQIIDAERWAELGSSGVPEHAALELGHGHEP